MPYCVSLAVYARERERGEEKALLYSALNLRLIERLLWIVVRATGKLHRHLYDFAEEKMEFGQLLTCGILSF